jgi:Zn ribbon nucleic-acid-binding protein
MDGCYLDYYSPCERCGKCGFVEKEEDDAIEENETEQEEEDD